MNSPHPVLYSFRRCPYAMRARMALHVSGRVCELREVVLRDKPSEFLALSPKGTVPVLHLASGEVLEQSLEIMRWALENNDPEKWLLTTDVDKDDSEALICACDGDFKHHLDRYKYANRYTDEGDHDHRAGASVFLQLLQSRLSQKRYLHGDRLRITDVAIAPFVRQFANTDREWFDAQTWPHLIVWLERFVESERFGQVMAKYKQWTSASEATYFPDE